MDRPTTPSRIDTDALERETGFGWGWFVVLGAALIVLAAVALLSLPPAGVVSVHAVGVVMLIGAFAQLGTTLLAAGLSGTGLFVLSAVLYGAAGTLAIVNPTFAATPLTLLLALLLICSGTTRIRLTSVMPSLPGWGWVAVSGFGSVVTGLTFFHLAPAKPIWLLGIALAVDLAFQGAMALAFGLALKANASAIASSS